MGNYSRVFASYSHFGLVTASYHRFSDGDEIVLVRVGTNVSFHLPHDQAVALRSALGEALSHFTATDPAVDGRAA